MNKNPYYTPNQNQNQNQNQNTNAAKAKLEARAKFVAEADEESVMRNVISTHPEHENLIVGLLTLVGLASYLLVPAAICFGIYLACR